MTTKKHILIITYNDYPVYEGLGVRIKNLARVFMEGGNEVTIFAPNIDNKRPKVEQVSGCRIIRLNIFVPAFLKKKRVIARAYSMVIQFFLTPYVYLRYLRNKPVNLIMAEHIYSIPSALVLKVITRSKVFVDDIITVSDVLAESGYRRMVKVFISFEKFLFRFCDEFIHTSPVSYQYYKARGATPTIYVPNGVNCDEFKPIENTNNKWVIFFNGSTFSPQNQEAMVNFIEIGKKLVDEGRVAFELRLICWPLYNLPLSVRNEIKKKLAWLDFKEGAERIENEIVKADITLLPYSRGHNLTGGTRLKALEYMACGKLVISTPEGISGITGLVPNEHFLLAESIEEFPRIISAVINAPGEMKIIAQNARAFVLDHYDWRKTMRELTDRLAII